MPRKEVEAMMWKNLKVHQHQWVCIVRCERVILYYSVIQSSLRKCLSDIVMSCHYKHILTPNKTTVMHHLVFLMNDIAELLMILCILSHGIDNSLSTFSNKHLLWSVIKMQVINNAVWCGLSSLLQQLCYNSVNVSHNL